MDKKVELQVLNITNSQAQVGAFAMLLGEVDGERQLPIIIGPAEAQATALYLKGIKTPRPLTHDLFTTSLTVLGVSLIRVLIYKAKDGIFYSYVYLKRDEDIIRIDARTSDAIALAVRADCPILMQFQSDITNKRVNIPDAEELSGIGAAYMAGISAGVYDLEKLAGNMKRSVYEPKMDDEIREKKYAGWKAPVDGVLSK